MTQNTYLIKKIGLIYIWDTFLVVNHHGYAHVCCNQPHPIYLLKSFNAGYTTASLLLSGVSL